MDSSYEVLLRYVWKLSGLWSRVTSTVYWFNHQSWRWVFDEPGMRQDASINITVMGSDQLSLQNLRCNWTNFMIFHIIPFFESLFFPFRAKLGQESGQSSSTPMTPQRARLYNRKGDASRRCQWLHGDRDEKWRGWEGGSQLKLKDFFPNSEKNPELLESNFLGPLRFRVSPALPEFIKRSCRSIICDLWESFSRNTIERNKQNFYFFLLWQQLSPQKRCFFHQETIQNKLSLVHICWPGNRRKNLLAVSKLPLRGLETWDVWERVGDFHLDRWLEVVTKWQTKILCQVLEVFHDGRGQFGMPKIWLIDEIWLSNW